AVRDPAIRGGGTNNFVRDFNHQSPSQYSITSNLLRPRPLPPSAASRDNHARLAQPSPHSKPRTWSATKRTLPAAARNLVTAAAAPAGDHPANTNTNTTATATTTTPP